MAQKYISFPLPAGAPVQTETVKSVPADVSSAPKVDQGILLQKGLIWMPRLKQPVSLWMPRFTRKSLAAIIAQWNWKSNRVKSEK